MNDEREPEEKLHAAERMLDQALRVIGILAHKVGGTVTLSEAELTASDFQLRTSLDAMTGSMTIRTTK